MVSATTSMASTAAPPACRFLEGKKNDKCIEADKCVQNCVGYGKVCPLSARKAGRAAYAAVQKLSLDSKVFPPNPCDSLKEVAKWKTDDLDIGERLGQGGFSEVHAVVVKKNSQEDSSTDEEEKSRYAIKYLQRKVMVHPKAFPLGASDLAVEAYFLATLKHKHIVELFAMTAGELEDNLTSGSVGCFFIVIDRLVDTLEQRIEKWRKELEEVVPSGSSRVRRPLKLPLDTPAAREQLQKSLCARLEVAKDICSAMQYLHSLNIIFRDLKGDNCGFDRNGVIKLFDFGLAKELRESDKTESGTYKLTGKTGSRRYMAPEVALEQPYSSSVDVYSFAILTWEMCALEKPFLGYSAAQHQKLVVKGHERPKMNNNNAYCSWPSGLQLLLQTSWSRHTSQRPTFETISQEIPIIVTDIQDACFSGTAGPPQRSRGTSVPEGPPPKFANMKRATKQGRAKTWGFPTRRQQQTN